MKHTYHIHGMTCNGCRSHVEKTLLKVKSVSNVSVNLEKEEATIEKGLWISGLYSSSKQGRIGKNYGYTSQGQGFTIGFDAEVKEDIPQHPGYRYTQHQIE